MKVTVTYPYGSIINLLPDYYGNRVRFANQGESFNVSPFPVVFQEIEWYQILDGPDVGHWLYGMPISRISGAEPMEKGSPRVQYARTYNVIPQDATEKRAVEIFLEGWRRSRETAGGSYDDAGIGNLNNKTANLYDIPVSEQQKYIDFYKQFYPDVKVVFPKV